MKDFTQGSVIRHLLQMSAFLAASMVVQTLYLLADLYWVGHLGKEAIAAIGVAGNLTMIVLALTQMLGVGTTTLISQAAGRKDQRQAELVFIVFNQSFVMSILIALALAVVSLNFVSAGIVFVTSSIFQGIGNTLPPLFSSMTRLILFALPALLISRTPGFEIRHIWYLSVGSIVLQMCVNLLLLRHELGKKLRFEEPETFIPASATAS